WPDAGPDNTPCVARPPSAGVSSVTVHNYYGTKSGVLLALVAESDRELIETLSRKLAGRSTDLIGLVLGFAAIIFDHTLTHLDKAIWRKVIAASVSDPDPRFGTLYRALDDRLAGVLVEEVAGLMRKGLVPGGTSADDLGRALFNIQNMRFIEFVANDDLSREDTLQRLERDLVALLGPAGRAGAVGSGQPDGAVLPNVRRP
ncbi:MAG: TetR/AcrR family transcriptional regulator, partial [Tabrizicola sp.]